MTTNRRKFLTLAGASVVGATLPLGVLAARPPEPTRYAMVLVGKRRVRTRFQDLKHGDVFTLYEADSTAVDQQPGRLAPIDVALSDAYISDFGGKHPPQWTIDCDEWVSLCNGHLKPDGQVGAFAAVTVDEYGGLLVVSTRQTRFDRDGVEALGAHMRGGYVTVQACDLPGYCTAVLFRRDRDGELWGWQSRATQ